MTITPAAIPSNYYNPLVKQGCFDADLENQINALQAANDTLVAVSSNSAFSYTGFGTAITLLPATTPAGTYMCSIYAVVTTTITTATSWYFVLGFTDDKQGQTPTVCTSSTETAGTAQQGTYMFRSNGTAAITLTPTAASAAAGVIAYSCTIQRIL
jgi:hypothetical protein